MRANSGFKTLFERCKQNLSTIPTQKIEAGLPGSLPSPDKKSGHGKRYASSTNYRITNIYRPPVPSAHLSRWAKEKKPWRCSKKLYSSAKVIWPLLEKSQL